MSIAWNPADPIETWLALGHENRWVRRACDPPLTRRSFTRCSDAAELKRYLEHGNWCLGSAFSLGYLCFIEQVAGAGEWLVIKQNVAFESASCGDMIAKGDGSIHFVCMDWRHIEELTAAGRGVYGELKNLCVWVKDNARMGSLYRSRHELVEGAEG